MLADEGPVDQGSNVRLRVVGSACRSKSCPFCDGQQSLVYDTLYDSPWSMHNFLRVGFKSTIQMMKLDDRSKVANHAFAIRDIADS